MLGTVPIAAYPLFYTTYQNPLQISYCVPVLQQKKIHFDDSSYWGMNMVAHYDLCFYKLSYHKLPCQPDQTEQGLYTLNRLFALRSPLTPA